MKTKTRPTPEQAAEGIRQIFAKQIPNSPIYTPGELSAYEAAKMIQEQSSCSFLVASEAVDSVIPELCCSYWEDSTRS